MSKQACEIGNEKLKKLIKSHTKQRKIYFIGKTFIKFNRKAKLTTTNK